MITMTCDRCEAEMGKGRREGRHPGSILPINAFDEKTKRLVAVTDNDICEKCAREVMAVLAKWWPAIGELQEQWNTANPPEKTKS